MTMNKFFTGLIALVAGVALSAGSAFATKGYVGGDPAMMKLVPYYETGDTKATIIGVQNLSDQETSTMMLNADVTDIQAYLDGMPANANAAGLIAGVDAEDVLMDTELDIRAAAEAALEKAMMAAYTEHVFVDVNVYDAMGMMMGEATLCLADHQFGYVVLQGPASDMENYHQGARLSVDDGDISAYGYVEVMAESTKYTSCDAEGGRTGRGFVRVVATNTGAIAGDTATAAELVSTKAMISAWTIIQDVGAGFFGTEVPTSTISMEMTGDDGSTDDVTEMGDPMIACYDGDEATLPNAGADPPVAGVATNRSGTFVMTRCGLIPERHNNDLATVTAGVVTAVADTMTPRARAVARYDAMDETMVVVWLAEGGDTDDTHPSMARMLDVIVKCEDGTVMTGTDQYGDTTDSIQVAAPGNLTMIDPTMGAVGDVTSMCAGDRGVLRITMPNGSHAGMVFSHITQMGGHYRMNFPGYSKANNMACDSIDANDTDAEEVTLCMAP